jgi:flagellar motor switch protein FliG
MNTATSGFKPGVLGGALRKGLQSPDLDHAGISHLDGPSKAAVVLMSLGPEKAGELLKQFTPAEAQKVSSLMATVRSINRDVMIAVLEEFKNVTEHRKQVPFDPQRFVTSLMDKFAGESGNSVASQVASSVPALDLLTSMSNEQLHRHLDAEHPQVVATLLSLIPADRSAAVLELFDEEMRDELVLRVALLDQINPSALVELNDMLERTLGAESSAQISGIGGPRPAAEILRLFTGGLEKSTLESIRVHSEKLADQIFERMFTFEDLMKIAPQAVQTLLTEIPDDVMLVVLKGASPNLQKFFFSNITKSKADRYRVEMDSLPPVRVQEVQAKQLEIVQTARQMQEEGLISLAIVNAGPGA